MHMPGVSGRGSERRMASVPKARIRSTGTATNIARDTAQQGVVIHGKRRDRIAVAAKIAPAMAAIAPSATNTSGAGPAGSTGMTRKAGGLIASG